MTKPRFLAVMIGILVFAMGAGETCMAIERAHYSVVESDHPYEIRDYKSSIVALVAVKGSRGDAVSSGFRRLADYIFGNNKEKFKIDMTAPVTQLSERTEPGSTLMRHAATSNSWVIRFMMPDGYTLESLPAPIDDRVHFAQIQARRVAVIRFSGFWSDKNFESHELQLLRWMQLQHLTPQSPATYAYYDPPWTPWFMRTIEILFDVAPAR